MTWKVTLKPKFDNDIYPHHCFHTMNDLFHNAVKIYFEALASCLFVKLNGSVKFWCALKCSMHYCTFPSYTGRLVHELIYSSHSTWLDQRFKSCSILLKPNYHYPFIISKIKLSVSYYLPIKKVEFSLFNIINIRHYYQLHIQFVSFKRTNFITDIVNNIKSDLLVFECLVVSSKVTGDK